MLPHALEPATLVNQTHPAELASTSTSGVLWLTTSLNPILAQWYALYIMKHDPSFLHASPSTTSQLMSLRLSITDKAT